MYGQLNIFQIFFSGKFKRKKPPRFGYFIDILNNYEKRVNGESIDEIPNNRKVDGFKEKIDYRNLDYKSFEKQKTKRKKGSDYMTFEDFKEKKNDAQKIKIIT